MGGLNGDVHVGKIRRLCNEKQVGLLQKQIMFPKTTSIFGSKKGLKSLSFQRDQNFQSLLPAPLFWSVMRCMKKLVKKLAHSFYLSYPTFHLEQWRRWRPPPLSSINYFLSSRPRPPLLSGNILLILSQELHHRHYLCLSWSPDCHYPEKTPSSNYLHFRLSHDHLIVIILSLLLLTTRLPLLWEDPII